MHVFYPVLFTLCLFALSMILLLRRNSQDPPPVEKKKKQRRKRATYPRVCQRGSIAGSWLTVVNGRNESVHITCGVDPVPTCVRLYQADGEATTILSSSHNCVQGEHARYWLHAENLLMWQGTTRGSIPRPRLQACQHRAIQYVIAHAREEAALQKLLKKYSASEVATMEGWIANDAELLIYVDSRRAGQLLRDPNYRNLFETGTSGGCRDTKTRARWETRMFGAKAYGGETQAADRPKYGTVNLTNDPRGVCTARAYGNVCLVLGEHMRSRVTLTARDSGSNAVAPATLTSCAHVLAELSDGHLEQVLAGAMRHPDQILPPPTFEYAEIQIHGPISMLTDIKRIVLPAGILAEDRSQWELLARRARAQVKG